jgi:N-acetyl sugar amidotransferase
MRPTTRFNSAGVCIACENVSKQANAVIDWQERNKIWAQIVEWAKSNKASGYDCIIGVSGGKDSTRQALFARENGLNPLLVSCVYPPEQQTDRGVHNLANLISLGFDTLIAAPAPGTSKELMRFCFKTYGNLFNATELALYGCLPIVATAYNIPLILLGENPALSWGTDVGGSLDYDGNRMKYMNTLKGGNPRQFAPTQMSDQELYWYYYPQDDELARANIRIVYQGYFMPDFNDHTNSRIGLEHGLHFREGAEAEPDNMGGIYPFVALDDDFVIVNQMMKYLKFGWGKATQEVGSAVRFGLMTREEGMDLVEKYDGKCAQFYIDKLCKYLEIDETEFWNVFDSFVNRDLFEKKNGHWSKKFEVE